MRKVLLCQQSWFLIYESKILAMCKRFSCIWLSGMTRIVGLCGPWWCEDLVGHVAMEICYLAGCNLAALACESVKIHCGWFVLWHIKVRDPLYYVKAGLWGAHPVGVLTTLVGEFLPNIIVLLLVSQSVVKIMLLSEVEWMSLDCCPDSIVKPKSLAKTGRDIVLLFHWG